MARLIRTARATGLFYLGLAVTGVLDFLIVRPRLLDPGSSRTGERLDVLMLAVTEGKERTQAAYQRLFDEAGIELVRTIPTATPFSIVEGRLR